jgi:antitoxin (DNA-binding transcriptional repressor) of toxin-antitoxin stability system
MKTIKIVSASRSLAEYAKELDDQIVVVTDRNKPFAAVVPLRNVDRESLALSSHPEFLQIIAKSRRQFAAGKTLSLAEMRRAALPRRTANKRGGEREKFVARPSVRRYSSVMAVRNPTCTTDARRGLDDLDHSGPEGISWVKQIAPR